MCPYRALTPIKRGKVACSKRLEADGLSTSVMSNDATHRPILHFSRADPCTRDRVMEWCSDKFFNHSIIQLLTEMPNIVMAQATNSTYLYFPLSPISLFSSYLPSYTTPLHILFPCFLSSISSSSTTVSPPTVCPTSETSSAAGRAGTIGNHASQIQVLFILAPTIHGTRQQTDKEHVCCCEQECVPIPISLSISNRHKSTGGQTEPLPAEIG